MPSTHQEFKEWLVKSKQPYIIINGKVSPYLIKEFNKYKKNEIFEKVKKSNFYIKRKPYNFYTNGEFKEWLDCGKVFYIQDKCSGLPKENILHNKRLYNMFIEYQNKY